MVEVLAEPQVPTWEGQDVAKIWELLVVLRGGDHQGLASCRVWPDWTPLALGELPPPPYLPW